MDLQQIQGFCAVPRVVVLPLTWGFAFGTGVELDPVFGTSLMYQGSNAKLVPVEPR